ncbi:aa3-type cytochrome c oxidase subunit IV [Devosia sp.]|uniref:aa3-type cytochrome c oxidase subunit IV n=1 Tax=Devosia sp. TaxID=1871048 RepID=UPI002FC6DC58
MATKHRPEHHAELQVESPMDYAQHEATYNGFLTFLKWSVLGLAVTAIILYFVVNP